MKMNRTETVLPFPEIRGNIESIRYPALAQVKLDGEATWVIKTHERGVYLTNKYGTERESFGGKLWHSIAEFCKVTNAFSILGELVYRQGLRGDQTKLMSHKDNDNELSFRAWDIANIDGGDTTKLPAIDRLQMLNKASPVTSIVVNSKADVDNFFKDSTECGYEGIVVKNIDAPLVYGPCSWVKIKAKDNSYFKIVTIDPVQERIEVDVLTPTPDGQIPLITKCGVKCTHKNKQWLKEGDDALIEHQGITSGGSLRHPVFRGHRSAKGLGGSVIPSNSGKLVLNRVRDKGGK